MEEKEEEGAGADSGDSVMAGEHEQTEPGATQEGGEEGGQEALSRPAPLPAGGEGEGELREDPLADDEQEVGGSYPTPSPNRRTASALPQT